MRTYIRSQLPSSLGTGSSAFRLQKHFRSNPGSLRQRRPTRQPQVIEMMHQTLHLTHDGSRVYPLLNMTLLSRCLHQL